MKISNAASAASFCRPLAYKMLLSPQSALPAASRPQFSRLPLPPSQMRLLSRVMVMDCHATAHRAVPALVEGPMLLPQPLADQSGPHHGLSPQDTSLESLPRRPRQTRPREIAAAAISMSKRLPSFRAFQARPAYLIVPSCRLAGKPSRQVPRQRTIRHPPQGKVKTASWARST